MRKDSTKHRAEGTFHEVKGAIESRVGHLTNDPDLEADRVVEKLPGKIQEKIAKAEKILEKR